MLTREGSEENEDSIWKLGQRPFISSRHIQAKNLARFKSNGPSYLVEEISRQPYMQDVLLRLLFTAFTNDNSNTKELKMCDLERKNHE